MRIARLVPGADPDAGLVGAVLAGDLVVAGTRWPKGRRLSAADLNWLARPGAVAGARRELPAAGLTVLVPGPDDVHEDDAAIRLADLVMGTGLTRRGPAESRVDLLAAADGVVHVRVGRLERLNRIDMIDVFTVFDRQVVRAGDLVASAKIAPHLIPGRSSSGPPPSSVNAAWSMSPRSSPAGWRPSSRNRSRERPESASRRPSV